MIDAKKIDKLLETGGFFIFTLRCAPGSAAALGAAVAPPDAGRSQYAGGAYAALLFCSGRFRSLRELIPMAAGGSPLRYSSGGGIELMAWPMPQYFVVSLVCPEYIRPVLSQGLAAAAVRSTLDAILA